MNTHKAYSRQEKLGETASNQGVRENGWLHKDKEGW